MGTGALLGGLSDIFNAGVGADFIKAVSEKLTPGKSAVIAEVAEEWFTPLDTRMEAIGGFVIREWRSDFEDVQIEKEISARKTELTQLKAEISHASEERKAKLKGRIDEAQAKLGAVARRAQALMDQLKQEVEAKIKELQTQAAKAKGDAKAKIERSIADLRTDYDRRSSNLKQAWELTREAVT